MDTEQHSANEAWLEERDERVKELILERLKDMLYKAQDLERDAQEIRIHRDEIMSDVLYERWYNLRNILSRHDIESLCAISPRDLLG